MRWAGCCGKDELQARFNARDTTGDLWMDANDLTQRLIGDTTPANVFVLGVALQRPHSRSGGLSSRVCAG